MAQVVAVANHKGGVGKTASVVNLGAAFAEAGKRVLIIDLDPQGHATAHLGVEDTGAALVRALQSGDGLPASPTSTEGLDLVASGPALAAVRQRFSEVMGGELLARSFERTRGDWDLVIIDCPPSLDVLALNALRLSRHLIIPVEASTFALTSLRQMGETLEAVRSRNPALAVLALVPCRAHPRLRMHREILARLEKLLPGRMAPVVRENVAVAEAGGRGQPVLRYAPDSAGASDYRAVASWLSGRLFPAGPFDPGPRREKRAPAPRG
jgi:chromosome partitioning protein